MSNLDILFVCFQKILKTTNDLVQTQKHIFEDDDIQIMWVDIAMKETKKTLLELLETQKRRMEFLIDIRAQIERHNHNSVLDMMDDSHYHHDDGDWLEKKKTSIHRNGKKHNNVGNRKDGDGCWIVNGKRVDYIKSPFDCPGFEAEYLNYNFCIHCGYEPRAHTLEIETSDSSSVESKRGADISEMK